MVSAMRDEAEATRKLLQTQQQAQRAPSQQPATGVKPLDAGLQLLNGLGGVSGVFALVDRFAK